MKVELKQSKLQEEYLFIARMLKALENACHVLILLIFY